MTAKEMWKLERQQRTWAVNEMLYRLPRSKLLELYAHLRCSPLIMSYYNVARVVCKLPKKRFIAAINQIRAQLPVPSNEEI